MKTLSIILTITFFSFSANMLASTPKPDSVTVTDSNRLDVMVLKFDKEQVGGQIVVIASNGEEVSRVTIKRKKMIIDFDEVKFGAYKIKVVKEGAEVAEFNYNKELVLSQAIR